MRSGKKGNHELVTIHGLWGTTRYRFSVDNYNELYAGLDLMREEIIQDSLKVPNRILKYKDAIEWRTRMLQDTADYNAPPATLELEVEISQYEHLLETLKPVRRGD